MKIVIVTWLDAGSGSSEEEAAGHIRRSVGYMTRKSKKGIWISMEDDVLSGVHFIPRGMVLGIQEIA